TFTAARGINACGQIVGEYVDGGTTHGYLLSGGSYLTLDPPGSTFTRAVGINASGQIVGLYNDTSGVRHGFLLSEGVYTTLDVPRSTLTAAFGLNNLGEIVGSYIDADGVRHAFLRLCDGSYITLDPPGLTDPSSLGRWIDDAGRILLEAREADGF